MCCDTMVALGPATLDGSVLFAKNSDREPNEAQELVQIPRASHPEGSTVRCTYIEIPQVRETAGALLLKPFWIWGAEMGANEHGVAVGNESLFTRLRREKDPGLIGMDLVRLALERADSARGALGVITGLLEKHGQGGNCGMTRRFHYDNSFLIADPHEAWVLETVGRHWAAEQVKDTRSISNAITIGDRWNLASEDLVDFATERGWCRGPADFDFGRCYSDFLYTRLGDARRRRQRTSGLLTASHGSIVAETMMAALRDHGPDAGADWTPARGFFGCEVCMHAGPGPIRFGQTVGSLVSHLTPKRQTHWVTGTSAPCTGVFKPVWLDAGLPDVGPAPAGTGDGAALWWRHETLHREVLRDYPARLDLYRRERDELEARFVRKAAGCRDEPAAERAAFSSRCFREADEATARWTKRVARSKPAGRLPLFYGIAWSRTNRRAKIG